MGYGGEWESGVVLKRTNKVLAFAHTQNPSNLAEKSCLSKDRAKWEIGAVASLPMINRMLEKVN